jgi:hypothetical protein
MSHTPCRERTFELSLSHGFEVHYVTYLYWLKHFLERLGREHTLAVWAQAFRDHDEGLLSHILSAGWEAAPEQRTAEVEARVADTLAALFPRPVEQVSREQAREIVEGTPPFGHIRRRFATLDVQRTATTYEALHLFRDGLALLAETMIARYGKQGELMVYDAMLDELANEQQYRVSAGEFLSSRWARFRSPPEEADMHTAGLEVELIRGSETEVVTRVVECEWARYFRERHPGVGYLLACSLDNPAYVSFDDRLRLQRTTTLMEGGPACDFRIYALPSAPEEPAA